MLATLVNTELCQSNLKVYSTPQPSEPWVEIREDGEEHHTEVTRANQGASYLFSCLKREDGGRIGFGSWSEGQLITTGKSTKGGASDGPRTFQQTKRWVESREAGLSYKPQSPPPAMYFLC